MITFSIVWCPKTAILSGTIDECGLDAIDILVLVLSFSSFCCAFARLFALTNLLPADCYLLPSHNLSAKHTNMAQIYQKAHHDYDGMQRSERRPSRGPLHAGDRGVPYLAYPTRPDPRNDSRTYVLPTPIHDLGEDSDQGSARKRTSMAVSLSCVA